MIRRLKLKFVALALAALFILLSFTIASMDFLDYLSVVRNADEVLSLITFYHGEFPDDTMDREEWLPEGMSPELPFETRFFSVKMNTEGQTTAIEIGNIFAIDAEEAEQLARDAVGEEREKGFIGNYRYLVTNTEMGTEVTFLDCGRSIDMFRSFTAFSIRMSLIGYAITAIAIWFFVGRLVRPAAEGYEKQKRFITDASHEIKTPLTIISANVDLLKMDFGENECLNDIEQQSKRLTELTNDLVYLARMEEPDHKMTMIDFPVSETVQEAASPFRTLAKSQEKSLDISIDPLLSMRGNSKAIAQLTSILLDNALKYSPSGGEISLRLARQGRKLVLTVTNPSVAPLDAKSLRHVFDRFYRTDPSRNSETGGHGIGLSLAQAIVTAHKGKIAATSPDGSVFCITATFPCKNMEGKGA